MKILSVKKRNFVARFLSVHHWKVSVHLNNGKKKTYMVWAGCPEFGNPYNVRMALCSLEEESGEDVFGQFIKGNAPEGIGRMYTAFNEVMPPGMGQGAAQGAGMGNIVIGVQQNQTQVATRSAAQIQASLRQQTSARVGVGVRQGK